jgi:deoxyribonuclease II
VAASTIGLNAKSEKNVPVDWWFMYKLPGGIAPRGKRKTQGNEYLYYEASGKQPLYLSPNRLGTGPKGALFNTLQQIIGRPGKRMGWIFYNDDYPSDMSPYKHKTKSFWSKFSAPKGAKLRDDKEKADLTKKIVAEGLVKKGDKPTIKQLLDFRVGREAVIKEVADIEADLIAKWKAGNSDWPPNVKPNINSGSGRKSDRGNAASHSSNGHCKGVLAFDLDSDTAFWLSHSTPRIPALKTPPSERFFYPTYADKYAQTFVCISLDNVQSACDIAKVMSAQHEPQVFGSRLPAEVTDTSKWKDLWQLAQGSIPPGYGPAYAKKHPQRPIANITFQSRGVGRSNPKTFQLLAKSGAWFDDFWIDMVGPNLTNVDGSLGVDLRVETWRRLTPSASLPKDMIHDPGTETDVYFGSHDFTTDYKGHQYHHEFLERDGSQIVDEITNIDLRALVDPSGLLTGVKGTDLTGYTWSYSRDHAKWAISEEDSDRGVRTIQTHNGMTLADEPGTVSDWVCVADMNRMTSQRKRGGGAVCFHEPLLWHGLNQIERISGRIT